MYSRLMEGKRGIIFGVANQMSLAWGITQQIVASGGQVALTYLSEAVEKRVRPLAESIGVELILPCDVTRDLEIEALFATLERSWGKIDFVVHSVAYAHRDDLRGSFSQISRSGFSLAMDISVYSLIAITRCAMPLLSGGGSILTLTYLGAQRAIPGYSVMGVAKAALESSMRYLAAELGEKGVRVNALSSGPVKTLAASAVPNFQKKLRAMEGMSPLRRNVTQEDVGKAALYLLSDLSSGVTGEVHFVDAGFNIMVST